LQAEQCSATSADQAPPVKHLTGWKMSDQKLPTLENAASESKL
jgi:hypothetical protein